MFDSGKVLAGLVIFLVLLTLPFWYGKGRTAPPDLSLDTPEIQKLSVKACIESTPYMKAKPHGAPQSMERCGGAGRKSPLHES